MLAIWPTPWNDAADLLQLLHGLRRLDEQAVGAGFEIHLAAPQRVVEAVHGARVGARDDVEVAAVARAPAAARILRTISSAGITSLPAMWPQRFGAT